MSDNESRVVEMVDPLDLRRKVDCRIISKCQGLELRYILAECGVFLIVGARFLILMSIFYRRRCKNTAWPKP